MSTVHDLCICAPTGSGKTLAYSLPLLQSLSSSDCPMLHCLRALIVLPTRDLAVQVYDLLAALAPAVGLRVGLAAAKVSVAEEASSIVGSRGNGFSHRFGSSADHLSSLLAQQISSCLLQTPSTQEGGPLPGEEPAGGEMSASTSRHAMADAAMPGCSTTGQGLPLLHRPTRPHSDHPAASCSGRRPDPNLGCGVDILVATPGRLMCHLKGTPGVNLQQLRFLVVDETDRLLRQSYQGWLRHVMADLQQQQQRQQQEAYAPDCGCGTLQPFGQQRVVKLIVSATLTHDPSKLAKLELHSPR